MAEAVFLNGNPISIKNYTPGSDIAAQSVVVVGDVPFVAHEAIASGVPGTLFAGNAIYRMTAGEAIATGKKVYWDNSANKVVETATGNKAFGYVIPGSSAAADGDSVDVLHCPDLSASTPAAVVAALTDSTGGTANSTLVAIGATNSGDVSANINNNFADLAASVNAILTALKAAGLMATS